MAATSLCLGNLAQADLRFVPGYPQGFTPVTSAQVWADTLAEVSAGELSAKVYLLSLLNLMETSPGLRDGMAAELTMLLDQQ
jgi:hypothetical protein